MSEADVNEGLLRLIVVAPMKSASTYVANIMRLYFGIRAAVELPHVDFDAEHNLTPALCYDVRGKDFCINFHMLPHRSNLTAADRERIGLVGLWRNLGDMILSMDEYVFKVSGSSQVFFVLDPEKYRALPAPERFAFMIDSVVPWYLGFYLRWRSLDMILHPYEQMLHDPQAYFMDVLGWVTNGLPVDDGLLHDALGLEPGRVSRFNVGTAGRSAEKFDDATKRRLEERLRLHPDREQLEILLWELPWDVASVRSGSPLDGSVVRAEGQDVVYFISSGRAHPVLRSAWLKCRVGQRREPRTISAAELRAFPVGDAMV